MSDVNKLDDKSCSFDPDQFNAKVDNVAPVGSFPWAMIQVYLKKPVGRSGWASNVYLIPEYDNSGNLIYIQQSDANGNPSTWVPEPKDMLACDWELVKIKLRPVECMLFFDLKIGDGKSPDGSEHHWGYQSTKGIIIGSVTSPFGTLTNLQSTVGIRNLLTFFSFEDTTGTFPWVQLAVDTQNQLDLKSKNFEVTVGGSTYSLGSSSDSDLTYHYGDAKQLNDLLKQNVGNTLSFCFNWK
ncbi:MW1434 family type I TA system toxin [Xenorhabdus sp. PB30.3]|uniref:Thoeris anti-defense Tad2 family protein n=1 Tax=Xenorhabdus sp. PB30.3 TaxID=2788941 RepID=UPI001E58E862|nr:MW1434 family type I TA system toxin [Xenorhabdus sp. PB30.3]MCC8382031.1 DUF2829 domain-containing protein [Xenorhabdus sp. PB30.3]